MFEYRTRVRMHHMDAAGAFFHPNLFCLFHNALEEFLSSQGLGIGLLLHDRDYIFPVVRVEADFLKPLQTGDNVYVGMALGPAGVTSLTLVYELRLADGTQAARGQAVHVAVDKATGRKIPVPEELRQAFQVLNQA